MDSVLRIKYQSKVYELPYTVTCTDRQSFSISITEEGQLVVRAPLHVTKQELHKLLLKKQHWIITRYLQRQESLSRQPVSNLTDNQREALTRRYIDAAREYFPRRVAYYQPLTGGHYTRITIRDQKTRWGSCSSKGTLSFNWRLMLAPPAILDYVVVHELCHLTHMDHSKAFWQAVGSVYPDYAAARKWLKEHGRELVL